MNQQTSTSGGPSPPRHGLLIGASLAALLLGVYQWVELIHIRSGGSAPLCSVNETIDCASVWNSRLADLVHDHTGIPLAGWGVAWAAIVLLLALELTWHARKGGPGGDIVLALRLTTAVGALVCLALLAYTIAIGVLCPTCFLFYILVAICAVVAFRLPKDTIGKWRIALLQSAGLLLISIALLFYPGRLTPQQNAALSTIVALNPSPTGAPSPEDPLAKFLSTLPPEQRQLVSDARALYLAAPLIDRPLDSNRLIAGNTRSPVHLIDWIDIRCPHCKHLEEALTQIRKMTPANSWSEEGRQFPLDSECNPNIKRSNGDHIACLAAKVLICLGGSPKANQVRATFFQRQGHLTVDGIWEIAAHSASQRRSLAACVESPETADMLQDDIDYAMQHHITGTPLVAINGRQAPNFPPFIYAMIIAGGNSDAAGFKVLPPPRKQVLER